MIGLDTNVIVRFLTQDDERQSAAAGALIGALTEDEPGFVSSVVLAEIAWVLDRAYGASRNEIAEAVEGLLRSREVVVENAPAAFRALAAFQRGRRVQFADALIAETATLAGASRVVTFDVGAAAETRMTALA